MGIEVRVTSLPDCDMHVFLWPTEAVPKASYDGKTTMGPWANMCSKCFPIAGVGLGTGRGQKLILDNPTETG